MKTYLWPADRKPPVPLTRSRWRQFLEYKMPLVTLYLMVAILIGVLLAPFVLVTVPSGYVGVVWKRFRGAPW
jgi:ABC-type antimicrobial peptide transport system permease subunit